MREYPILFSAPMVRALLDGSKTQTRRVVKLPVIDKAFGCEIAGCEINGELENGQLISPFGKVGDQLWVRETFTGNKNNFGYRADAVCGGMGYDGNGQKMFIKHGYILDETCKQTYTDNFVEGFNTYGLGYFSGKWKPSIHMPRWASRIQLEITNIRVERLNDCSEADAIAEGIERVGGAASVSPWRNYRIGESGEMSLHCSAPTRSYMTLWESINGAGSWESNPWVWVVEFEVQK